MEIKFDYSLDSQGFFNDTARREALEEAGKIWSNLLQDEFENIPVGAEFTITNPVTGTLENIVLDTEIDDLLIFVGGTDSIDNLAGDTITAKETLDSNYHFTCCCCSHCLNDVTNLSQNVLGEDETNNNLIILAKAQVDGGDLQGDIFQRRISRNFRDSGEVVTDFEPWVGTIAFNSTANWDFSLEDTDPNRRDFISVALHEIAHILGIGIAPSFDALVQENQFYGVNSLAVNNGQPIPLDETAGHVSEDFSNNQVLLDPTLNEGRALPSDIDLALLADIGYEIDGFDKQGSVLDIATNSEESIFGTKFQDVIDGLGGNDSIQGDDGDDILNGGTGHDTITGNDGNDLIFGDDDPDALVGDLGDDTIYGGTGNDLLLGDEGNDLLFGNDDGDELQGGEGDDNLQGGTGNDSLFGDGGQDLLIGNEGDDNLQGGTGNDSLQGGAGNDTIFGEAGEDRINGGLGNDILVGGADGDRFVFEPGSGEDAINDFTVGEDIIEVSPDYGFNNAEELVAAITATGTSSNTDQLFSQVTFSPGNVLTIFHALDTSLSAASFAIGTSESKVSIQGISLEEGNQGNTDFTFNVSLSEVSSETITVDYATANGSAIADRDYIATNGTLEFAPGETKKIITVEVVGDSEVENNEIFLVNLSNVSGGALEDSQGIGTVTNDDEIISELSIDDVSLAEGNEVNTEFTFTVSLSQANDETVTVDYTTADDSAIAGEDYITSGGTLEFAPGETEKTITVQVSSDTEFEPDEAFLVNLSNTRGAAVADSQGTATIINDEANPLLDTNIYRFRNTDIPGTYLFAGPGESEAIRANFPNFAEEGLAFRVAVEPGDDLIPLYRFQSINTSGTYLFVGEEERQGIRQNFSESFIEEGLAFYVYGAGAGLGAEFTRFQNSNRPGTYLFAGPGESEGIKNNFPSFIEEGVAFEV